MLALLINDAACSAVWAKLHGHLPVQLPADDTQRLCPPAAVLLPAQNQRSGTCGFRLAPRQDDNAPHLVTHPPSTLGCGQGWHGRPHQKCCATLRRVRGKLAGQRPPCVLRPVQHMKQVRRGWFASLHIEHLLLLAQRFGRHTCTAARAFGSTLRSFLVHLLPAHEQPVTLHIRRGKTLSVSFVKQCACAPPAQPQLAAACRSPGRTRSSSVCMNRTVLPAGRRLASCETWKRSSNRGATLDQAPHASAS